MPEKEELLKFLSWIETKYILSDDGEDCYSTLDTIKEIVDAYMAEIRAVELYRQATKIENA